MKKDRFHTKRSFPCPLFFPYVALLDPSHDNVLKDIRNVYTG